MSAFQFEWAITMSIPRFTPRQLDAFVTVAEVLSFVAASDKLSLSPSAVSQLISELEGALGFRLFERSTRKVVLSAAGREFLPSAKTALNHLFFAESAASDVLNRVAGIVRVAAPLVLASCLLPQAIRAYTKDRPKLVIRIRDSAVDRLPDLVARGDVDLALGPDWPVGDDLQRLTLFSSPWVLWCAPEHPLAVKRSVTWSALKDHALVATSRDHERSIAQMRSRTREEDAGTQIEVVDSVLTALGLAAANLAATVSPAYVSALATSFGLVMRRILEPEIVRHASLYLPAQRVPSPAASGFAEFLIAWVPQFMHKSHDLQPSLEAPENGNWRVLDPKP